MQILELKVEMRLKVNQCYELMPLSTDIHSHISTLFCASLELQSHSSCTCHECRVTHH